MTDKRKTGGKLFASDDGDFDQESESGSRAKSNGSGDATVRPPKGLFMLMAAPLLLIAVPFFLLVLVPEPPAPQLVPAAPAVQEQSTSESSSAVKASPAPVKNPIAWQRSFSKALALSKKSGKPIIADFYADWCVPCKAMDTYTWTDPAVVEQAKKVIAVKLNVDAPENRAACIRYKAYALPCIVWMDSNGSEIGRSEGALGPPDMLELMQKYL